MSYIGKKRKHISNNYTKNNIYIYNERKCSKYFALLKKSLELILLKDLIILIHEYDNRFHFKYILNKQLLIENIFIFNYDQVLLYKNKFYFLLNKEEILIEENKTLKSIFNNNIYYFNFITNFAINKNIIYLSADGSLNGHGLYEFNMLNRTIIFLNQGYYSNIKIYKNILYLIEPCQHLIYRYDIIKKKFKKNLQLNLKNNLCYNYLQILIMKNNNICILYLKFNVITDVWFSPCDLYLNIYNSNCQIIKKVRFNTIYESEKINVLIYETDDNIFLIKKDKDNIKIFDENNLLINKINYLSNFSLNEFKYTIYDKNILYIIDHSLNEYSQKFFNIKIFQQCLL